MLKDFKKFILRGHLVDMAIGFTVGAAFTTVAKSLVNDIIMPPIGWLLGSADFADLFVVLRQGKEILPPYQTLAEAQKAGAVTINYGLFVNSVIALLLVALAMFFIMRAVNRAEEALDEHFGDEPKAPEEPTEKKCPYCRSVIPYQATRCSACTSHLE